MLLLRGSSQSSYVGKTGKKTSALTACAQDVSNFVFIIWGRSFPYGVQLLGFCGYSPKRQNMSEDTILPPEKFGASPD
jgi:hypothetical protein